DHHRRDAVCDEQPFKGLPVEIFERQKNGYDENSQPDDFRQEFRNVNVLELLEIQVPYVSVHERDDEHAAEDHRERADAMNRRQLKSQQGRRQEDREAKRKQVIENSEANAMLALELPPEQQHQVIDKRRDDDNKQDLQPLMLQPGREMGGDDPSGRERVCAG